ncbi:oxygen-independent coproporphyrinogen-3 oxidase [Microbulbifer donghaiensis]|uniref:Coproporphyrinogen-III oxidase n=1 Tax=Microbulbifer donghaiensis TaxID=494016 RepID=A0A1M4XV48_9GAMM|nr:oxygen-independent coproporphyrinogen III oxidase [Microbulbifer donghaiensis]SHE97132.1 oxygen-independent coproporphyrinogen-3 oxidase [Microbulbifer donghaiensis]
MKLSPKYDKELLHRYDRPLPRYTSYPTAVKFEEGFRLEDWRKGLGESIQKPTPFSLYFHIPFCRSPCFYCACNRIITRDSSRSQPYLEAIYKEIELVARQLPAGGRNVSQVHFGGGTPTFLSSVQLEELWRTINRHFELDPDGEYSIEVDPRASSVELIEKLTQLGFNRMSFGIQDLDPEVQKAVNRLQSAEETFAQIAAAKKNGVKSVNVDLIYGLPKQTANTFGNTIEQVIDARPERVAVYGYAHMPHLFKAQTQIDKYDIPSLSEKLGLLEIAIDQFLAAGYEYIGLDHFALPDDELAIARRQNTLHRNFQGYSTQKECDMLGFGVTAIGKIGDIFYQNLKSEKDYLDCLKGEQLPINKGYRMTPDDKIRGQLIMSLMCHGRLEFDDFESLSAAKFTDYFSDVIDDIATLEYDGLIETDSHGVTVTPVGQLLLRNICHVFDEYRKPRESKTRIHALSI